MTLFPISSLLTPSELILMRNQVSHPPQKPQRTQESQENQETQNSLLPLKDKEAPIQTTCDQAAILPTILPIQQQVKGPLESLHSFLQGTIPPLRVKYLIAGKPSQTI